MLKRRYGLIIWLSVVGLVLAACLSSEPTATPLPDEMRIWLLTEVPTESLPANRPVEVRSRTQDFQYHVSHIELYAVELPSGERDVLIRSDPAPFQQTTFTAVQTFTPVQPGHYVVKVIGYNKRGEQAESEYIGFDIE